MSRQVVNSVHGVYGQRGGLVRFAYLLGACGAWVLTLGGRLGSRRAVVLCYHGVTDSSRERFAAHVRIAARRAVTLADAGGSKPRGVCFTFDDAFANLLRNALPVMAGAGVPSVVFAVSENLGTTPKWEMREGHPERGERIMTAEELRQAEQFGGCRVQSHTATHARLGVVPIADASEELRRSKAKLEEVLGHSVDEVAAPYGSWTRSVYEAARAMGYARFLTLDPHDLLEPESTAGEKSIVAKRNGHGEEPYLAEGRDGLIGRYLMTPETSALEFRLTIDGAYGWVFGLRRWVRRLHRTGAGKRASRTHDGAVARSAT